MESAISINFPGISAAEADRSARELCDQINRELREEGLDAAAQQQRVDHDAQNLGEIVQILLSAPVSVALSHGIALGIQKYMARTNRSKLEIGRTDGISIIINDVESRDLAKIIGAISAKDFL